MSGDGPGCPTAPRAVARPGPAGSGPPPRRVTRHRPTPHGAAVSSTRTTPPSPTGTGRSVRRPGDRVFAGTAKGAGILILVILAGVAAFLVVEAVPALTAPAEEIPGGAGLASYIAP